MFETLFGEKGLSGYLTGVRDEATRTAEADKELAERSAQVTQDVVDSATTYNEAARGTLSDLDQIRAKSKEADEMARSANPFDRITLMGEQILNPRDYTAEGRTQRMSELSTSLALNGQVHNVQIAASQANLQHAQAERNVKVAGLGVETAALKATIDGMRLATEGMTMMESMRQINLTQIDQPTLEKALVGPTDSSGKVTLGDMQYTPVELRERARALQTREQLSLLSPQETDPDYATRLRAHHTLELSTYKIPELEELRANGYKMKDGTQVEPSVWDTQYQRETEIEARTLQRSIGQLNLKFALPKMLEQGTQITEAGKKFAQPGTPLQAAQNRYLSTLNTIAEMNGRPETTPEHRMQYAAMAEAAQNEYMKTVDSESMRRAGGDKQLAIIYRDQMLGVPVQAQQVEDVMRQRYIERKGFGEILPSDSNNRIRKAADQLLDKKRRDVANPQNMFETMKYSDKELREQSINEAMEAERINMGVTAINHIQMDMTRRTDHPAAKAGMVQAGIQETMTRSQTIAIDKVGKQYDLTQEQILALKAGNPDAAGLSGDKASLINSRINLEAAMVEYEMYENHKTGLGYEVQQWMTKTLPEAADNYKQRLDPLSQAMMGDAAQLQAMNQIDLYSSADESATDRGKELVMQTATGAKRPENSWMLMINMSDRLELPQKQELYYEVVMPAMQAARSQGLDDVQTNEAIFNAMAAYEGNNPILKGSIKSFSKELPGIMEKYDQTWNAAIMMQFPAQMKLRAQRAVHDPVLANESLKKVIPWVK